MSESAARNAFSRAAFAAAKAELSSAMTQGLGVAMGLQEDFSWEAFATSVVGAGLGAGAGSLAGDAMNRMLSYDPGMEFDFTKDLVSRTGAGLASSVTAAAVRGGKIEPAQVAADAFGNALAGSITSQLEVNKQAARLEAEYKRQRDALAEQVRKLQLTAPTLGQSAGSYRFPLPDDQQPASAMSRDEQLGESAEPGGVSAMSASALPDGTASTPFDGLLAAAVSPPRRDLRSGIPQPSDWQTPVTDAGGGGAQFDPSLASANPAAPPLTREEAMQRLRQEAQALEVEKWGMTRAYEQGVNALEKGGNGLADTAVLTGLTALTFLPAFAEESVRGVLNIPSNLVMAIPRADEAGTQFGVAADPSRSTEARVVAGLSGTANMCAAFTGLAAPASLTLAVAEVADLSPTPVSASRAQSWPGNNGFVDGEGAQLTVLPGQTLDRYGGPGGRFLAPAGTPLEMRSLMPGTENRPLMSYEVMQPFYAEGGHIAPAFGQPGGGLQFFLRNRTVQDLVDAGIVRPK